MKFMLIMTMLNYYQPSFGSVAVAENISSMKQCEAIGKAWRASIIRQKMQITAMYICKEMY